MIKLIPLSSLQPTFYILNYKYPNTLHTIKVYIDTRAVIYNPPPPFYYHLLFFLIFAPLFCKMYQETKSLADRHSNV